MTEQKAAELVKQYKEELKNMSKKERKALKKDKKKRIKQALKDHKDSKDTNLVLLVILAIIFPPLAMGIYEGGLTTRFWISLLLTLLFYLPGLIYTLVIILGGQ